MMHAFTLVAALTFALGTSLEECGHDQTTCRDNRVNDAVHSSALLQTRSAPIKIDSLTSKDASTKLAFLNSAYLQGSRSCVSEALQEAHLQAAERHAALLVTNQRSAKQSSLPAPVVTRTDGEYGAAAAHAAAVVAAKPSDALPGGSGDMPPDDNGGSSGSADSPTNDNGGFGEKPTGAPPGGLEDEPTDDDGGSFDKPSEDIPGEHGDKPTGAPPGGLEDEPTDDDGGSFDKPTEDIPGEHGDKPTGAPSGGPEDEATDDDGGSFDKPTEDIPGEHGDKPTGAPSGGPEDEATDGDGGSFDEPNEDIPGEHGDKPTDALPGGSDAKSTDGDGGSADKPTVPEPEPKPEPEPSIDKPTEVPTKPPSKKPTEAPNPVPTPDSKPAPPRVVAQLTEVASAGAQSLAVDSNMGFSIGQVIIIDAGAPIEEFNKIVRFGSLILESPLKYDHAAGASISTESTIQGSTASLDAAGFKLVTSLCCPSEMEQFFNRLLEEKDLDVCSKPHIQGLMHWFSCVPDMDFQYMIGVIESGNPCKYWGPRGADCPVLSPECAGQWCR